MVTKTCIDEVFDWKFNKWWWYSALSLVTVFLLFVLYDYIIKKTRRTPSKLMLGRMISNYCQALVFLLTVKSGVTVCSKEIICDTLGAVFTISLLISASYYTVICFDLYFTLKNPFRKPASNSMWIHFIVIFTAFCITIPIGSARAFEYREDFQFCWTVYKDGFNFWNLFIVYVPATAVIIGGIAVTYWSLKRLKARILDDTFELRWKVIRRQTTIVGCFTINYVIQGIIWMITFKEHNDTPTHDPPQPYLLSVFVICAVLFDLIAWCARDSILINNKSYSNMRMYDETDSTFIENTESTFIEVHQSIVRPITARTQLLNEKYCEKKIENKSIKKLNQQQNLSNALRREVITFITAGLVQCIKVTAWETNKRNTHFGTTYDDDFNTETHPALQLFANNKTHKMSTESTNGFSDRHRRGSYKYQAKLGKHSTVAVSIPLGIGYDVKENEYDVDFTDTRTVDDDESTSNCTPSVSTQSTSNSLKEKNERMCISMNGDEWNGEDQTLEFDVGNNINNDAAIYSASLFATDEAEPPITYYPQSIKVNAATKKNTGTVNRFNIGIAGSDKVSFTDYAPHVFRYLRTKVYNVTDSHYLESILPLKFGGAITRVSEDIIANFSEGRSGAFFFFTPDNKYLIKTLNKTEAQLLIETLSDYVKYMKQYGNKSFLTKYYGAHSVKLYSKRIYFMVSENIFPSNISLRERYDIKGSWIDRHTNRHLFENKLMKDEDLHRKLRLDPIISSQIHSQLVVDTAFLQKLNIMDYSLLLGVSYQQITNKKNQRDVIVNNTVKANIVEGPGTYYIGVIDMLQRWNKQKKGEKFIKVYFRCKNRAGISCVEPVFYRKRFLKKMQKMGL